MRAVDITEENLEDLLAYDDLFLDYFNAFLSLPVFPQPLYYNRLTGTFLEVPGTEPGVTGAASRTATPPYGATDDERDRMLEWAKEERLPLFLRTELFREFKLCKLLLRPLEDRCSASRLSSRQLRGISRQTDTYVSSSLSNSAHNSAGDADLEEDANCWPNYRLSGLYRYRRPGSNAYSLPTRLGLATISFSASSSRGNSASKETSNATDSNKPTEGSRNIRSQHRQYTSAQSRGFEKSDPEASNNSPSTTQNATQKSSDRNTDIQDVENDLESRASSPTSAAKSAASLRDSASGRSRRSARQRSRNRRRNTVEIKESPADQMTEEGVISDYDAVFGEAEPRPDTQALVAFAPDVISDMQTETDVKTLEGKHQMTLQQMKEHVIGSVEGMEKYKSFLSRKLGGHLLKFWMDCEYFKDTMEDHDEEVLFQGRHRLFRDIQDRHKMTLTKEAKNQLCLAASNTGLTHTIFLRAQYDMLRRLRVYWLPRYLIHKERHNELLAALTSEGHADLAPEDELDDGEDHTASCFFPSISFVKSLPVRPDDLMHNAMTTSWEAVSKAGRTYDDRVKSAKPTFRRKCADKSLREKFILAMMTDKAAGGPFKSYLERQKEDLLGSLLFWEEVTEYGQGEDRSADRLLRLVHAWDIFNKYISSDSKDCIGVEKEEEDSIRSTLANSKDLVDTSIFSHAKECVVDNMETSWIRFLKEDLKAYIECHLRSNDSRPGTAEEFEVYFDEELDSHGRLVVRRPRPWVQKPDQRTEGYPPSTSSERGRRLRTALSLAESIDESRMVEVRRRAREKRKEMEKERKKAVRAAYKRQREAKRTKNVSFKKPGEEDEEGIEEDPVEGQEEEQKIPTFQESLSNKAVMSVFKKYLSENDGRDIINKVNLCMDIQTYHDIGEGKNSKAKKDMQAQYIYKNYIEQGARKRVLLHEKVYAKIKAEKERPKTPSLKDARHSILPSIEEQFKTFVEVHAEAYGLDSSSMGNLSKVDLAMHSNDPSLLGNWKGKGKGPKGSAGGRSVSWKSSSSRTRPASPEGPELVPSALLNFTYTQSDFNKSNKRSKKVLGPAGGKEISDVSGALGTEKSENVPNPNHQTSPSPSTDTRTSTTTTMHSRQRSVTRNPRKKDGRAQPTNDDKLELMVHLNQAAAGQFPQQMVYFYKYLVKHGTDDGCPLIDKDLFFYCEILKFKACNHQFADEEMLKRKTQSILDVYLDSSSPPTLQIDIPSDIQQKTVRAAQKYIQGKEVIATVFDEAQFCVFKELLPYWAGFTRRTTTDSAKTPLTKVQRQRLKRLEEFLALRPPSAKRVILPAIPRGTSVAAFSYSLNDGIKWMEVAAMDYDGDIGRGSVAGSLASNQRASVAGSTTGSLRQRRVSVIATNPMIPSELSSRSNSMATIKG